jgi:hypothetical protein
MRVLVLSLLFLFSTTAFASEPAPQCRSIDKLELLRGGGDVWPWGEEMPFPWRGIKGVWMAEIEGCPTYFTFTALKMQSGAHQLQVRQYDPVTCKLISRGVGYEQDRYVKAVLVGKKGTFDIAVHVFKNEPGKADPRQRYTERKTSTVLTLGSFDEIKDPASYQLYKMHNDPNAVCPEIVGRH